MNQTEEPPVELYGKLYYEAHITIEPVFNEDLKELTEIVVQFGFKVADLLFQKRIEDTPIRSSKDTFCTSRGRSYRDIEERTINCVRALQNNGFKVFRWKLEDTLRDEKIKNA